jgi:hypothetical protein
MKGKIFNTQEVQAIIAGNKTMFREVVKPKLDDRANCGLGIHDNGQLLWDARDDCGYYKNYDEIKCPYQVGQKIFVKESFLQKLGSTQLPSGEHETFFTGSNVEYVADGAQERWDNPDVFYPNWWKKRPAQHMKQEHSRLTLEITSIKVERLQDINYEDAIKEGVWNIQEKGSPRSWDVINAFRKSWNATHKKPEKKFEANPFVWVVDFKINK